jgi:hypothetical protein
MVRKRSDRRLRLAGSRPLAGLAAIPKDYRLPEEQQRLEEEAAKRAAILVSHRKDKEWTAPMLSAALCFCADLRAQAAQEIQTEQAYAAKYGGVVDRVKLYGLQQEIRTMDETMAATRALLVKQKATSPFSGS